MGHRYLNMSSMAKAAVISAVIFSAILVAFFLMVERRDPVSGEGLQEESKELSEVDRPRITERDSPLSGRILTDRKVPIAGARVIALEDLAEPMADVEELLSGFIRCPEIAGRIASETLSAEDGTYQLDGLGQQYYTVRAIAAGYTPKQVPGVRASRHDVDIVLEPGLDAGGIVKDEKGVPVEGAMVKAYRDGESESVFDIIMEKIRPPIDMAITGSDGTFRFETLGPGIFNFLIKAKGYQQAQELKKNASQGMSFILNSGFTIAGVIRGPDNEPVRGARIRADGANFSRRNQVSIRWEDDSIL